MVETSTDQFLIFHNSCFVRLTNPLSREGSERKILIASFDEFQAEARECLGKTVTQEGLRRLYEKMAKNRWLVMLNRHLEGLKPRHAAHST